MKRRLLLFLILALLCAAAVGVWKYRPRLFHGSETSLLYERYRQCPGVEADFIRNMRIDDTTAVDVTVLHAADSAAWAALMAEFAISPATEFENLNAGKGREVIRLVHYRGHADTASIPPVVAVSMGRHTVSVFHVDSDAEKHAIIYYNFDKSLSETEK